MNFTGPIGVVPSLKDISTCHCTKPDSSTTAKSVVTGAVGSSVVLSFFTFVSRVKAVILFSTQAPSTGSVVICTHPWSAIFSSSLNNSASSHSAGISLTVYVRWFPICSRTAFFHATTYVAGSEANVHHSILRVDPSSFRVNADALYVPDSTLIVDVSQFSYTSFTTLIVVFLIVVVEVPLPDTQAEVPAVLLKLLSSIVTFALPLTTTP